MYERYVYEKYFYEVWFRIDIIIWVVRDFLKGICLLIDCNILFVLKIIYNECYVSFIVCLYGEDGGYFDIVR